MQRQQQQQQGEEEVRKTVRSAVVWIVPEEQWGRIQAVRAEHDKSYRRWPPHVNLLYPFVEEGQLIAANRQQRHQQQSKTILERLGEACRGVQPFSVGLRAVGRFAHGARSHTLWVGPARGGAALVELQRRLQAAVPACDDLGRIEAAGFTPHVTLGQWRCSAADAAAAQRALAAEWASLPPLAGCCVVDRIAVITRRGDEPFAVRAVIPLGDGAGGGVPRWVDDSVPYVPSSSSSSSSAEAGADCMQQQEHAEQSTRLEMMVWSSERSAWLPTSSKSGSASTSHEESSPSSPTAPAKTALRIATWNVLHEPGLEARVAGATAGARAAAALAALEKVGADVAVLEEVSAEFRAALLGAEWVRGGFAVSAATSSAECAGDERGGGEGSRSAKTARESRRQGIAVVVRRELAAEAIAVRHSRFKQSVVVSVCDGDGGATPGWPVRIAGVHLTSDFARGLDGVVGADAAARIKAAAREQGAQRRGKQLAEVAAACSASLGSGIGCGGGGGAAACVIAGDMNIGDGAQREWAGVSRLFPGAVVDCWKAAAGGAAGVTYDPERNAAAAATTQSGRRERFDRVLLWDPSGFAPTPSAASAAATAGAVAREEWHWWPARAEMFGTEALPGTRAPTGHGGGGEEREGEEGLVTSASDHFGVVVDLELRAGRGDADAAAAAGVCDMGGSETGVEDAAALAAAVGESEEEGGSGSEEARAWAVVDAVRRAAEHGAPGRVVCAATGSLLLGVWRSGCGSEAKGSDVDIVCVGSSESRAAFFGRVSAGLRGSVAAGTTVPVLRGRMDGISVEVQYAQVSEEHLPTTVLGAAAGESQAAGTGAAAVVAGLARNTRAMRGLDEASVRALSGVADNAAVGAAVDAVGPAARGQFRGVVRAVKAWAVSRGVYAARMGFLGGLGWAVLAARAVQRIRDGAVPVGDALRRFFAMYAQWDFCGTPLSLVGHAPPPSASSQQQQQPAAMIVWTPTRPHFNIARNATRSTVAALRQELQAAAGVLLEGAGQRMIQMQPQPPPWRMVFGASGAVRNALVGRGAYGEWLRSAGLAVGAVVAVTVSGLSKGGFERLRGAVEARLVGLVVRLERLCGGAAVARLFGTALWPPAGQHHHPHPHACCYGVSVAVPAGLVGSGDGSSIGTSTAGAAGYAVDVVGPAQAWEHGVVEDAAAAAATKAGDAFLSVRCFTPDKVPAWMLSDSALDSSADGDGCDEEEEEEGIAPQAATAEMGDGNDDDDDGRSRAGLVVRPGGSRAEKGKKGKQGTRRQQQEKEKEKEKRAASPTRGGKLRTSEDVYHRLRWDPALNAAEYTVCYEDRFLGLVEVAVDEFDTDTIPFHRVWVFKHRGDVVWDRQRRIDKVF